MIFIEPILETPIYLHSYSSEKVNQKFPSKATVAKQPSSEVLQHCSSILRVPPTGFKINMNNILPGYSKWGGREIPCFAYLLWTDAKGWFYMNLVGWVHMILLQEKDTARYNGLPIYQGEGQFSFEKNHRGLDEMLTKSKWHGLTVNLKENII